MIGAFFMPYCSKCGEFSIQLDSRNHCQPCSDAHFEGNFKEKDIAGAKIKTERQLRYKMLNYVEDIELKPIVIGSNFTTVAAGQRQINFNHNFQPTYIKSTIALISSLLGIVLFIVPFLSIFSLGCELIALSLAISSRRTEQPNWRRKIAIAISLIYIIIIIAVFIYFLLNPEILEEIMAELEAQGFFE